MLTFGSPQLGSKVVRRGMVCHVLDCTPSLLQHFLHSAFFHVFWSARVCFPGLHCWLWRRQHGDVSMTVGL